MKGLDLFLHSWRQVAGNLRGALKVSALPYAIQIAAGLAITGSLGHGVMAGQEMIGDSIPVLQVVLAVLVLIVTSLWIAVAWHRFVLLGEEPKGFLPAFPRDRIQAYFLASVAIFVALILASIPLGLLSGLLAIPLVTLFGAAGLRLTMAVVVWIPLFYLSFRLSAALPAAALGRPSSFMDGWNATREATQDLLVLAGVSVVASLVLGILGTLPILGLVIGLVGNWLALMIGISILTTLYGHYVQGRALT